MFHFLIYTLYNFVMQRDQKLSVMDGWMEGGRGGMNGGREGGRE